MMIKFPIRHCKAQSAAAIYSILGAFVFLAFLSCTSTEFNNPDDVDSGISKPSSSSADMSIPQSSSSSADTNIPQSSSSSADMNIPQSSSSSAGTNQVSSSSTGASQHGSSSSLASSSSFAESCNGNYCQCGELYYDKTLQFCRGGTPADYCEGKVYSTDEFCQDNTSIQPLCDGKEYLAGQFCEGSAIKSLCNNVPYNVETQICSNGAVATGFIDSRDGKGYRTVEIGEQVWMAENLNYAPPSGNSWCYEGTPSGMSSALSGTQGCDLYGRLYDCYTADTVCPSGWHLPNNEEWKVLAKTVGGASIAGAMLKSALAPSEGGWDNDGATTYLDSYSFSALPGGSSFGESFSQAGSGGSWWTGAEGWGVGVYWGMSVTNEELYNNSIDPGVGTQDKKTSSVRCVKD